MGKSSSSSSSSSDDLADHIKRQRKAEKKMWKNNYKHVYHNQIAAPVTVPQALLHSQPGPLLPAPPQVVLGHLAPVQQTAVPPGPPIPAVYGAGPVGTIGESGGLQPMPVVQYPPAIRPLGVQVPLMVDTTKHKPRDANAQQTLKPFVGTTLCGCGSYRSPNDRKSHCCGRFAFACCCSPCAVGALVTSAVSEKPRRCGMGSIGTTTCAVVTFFTFLGGLGCLAPALAASLIRTKYAKTEKKSGGVGDCAKSCCCQPCFLVQMRNWVELAEYKKIQAETKQPAQQLMI